MKSAESYRNEDGVSIPGNSRSLTHISMHARKIISAKDLGLLLSASGTLKRDGSNTAPGVCFYGIFTTIFALLDPSRYSLPSALSQSSALSPLPDASGASAPLATRELEKRHYSIAKEQMRHLIAPPTHLISSEQQICWRKSLEFSRFCKTPLDRSCLDDKIVIEWGTQGENHCPR